MQCNDCGSELIAHDENGVTWVEPCKQCMEQAKQEGKEEAE